jgi:hypothetical protein
MTFINKITLDSRQMTIIHNGFQVNVTKWLDSKIWEHEHVIAFGSQFIPTKPIQYYHKEV